MELYSSNFKKVLVFSQKKAFLIFRQKKGFLSENETLHFSTQAREIKKNPPEENFLCFRKWKPEKNSYFSYIFGNGTFESKA